MKQTRAALLVLAISLISGVAFPEDKAQPIQFLNQEWSVAYPDQNSGTIRFQDPSWVGLVNRAYISRPWTGGEIEFLWAHMLTKPMGDLKENISYADHLVIGLRSDGSYQPKRSFELNGSLRLRIRAGDGQIRFEGPFKPEGNELIKSASVRADQDSFGLEPGRFHKIKIVDRDGQITVYCDGKEVLTHAFAPAREGNRLVIGNREVNGGFNISILAPAK